MPGKVSLGGTAYEAVEVDLWGSPYRTVAVTRSVSGKADAAHDKINAAEEPDAIVGAIAEMIDLRVRPVEGTKKASTLIKEKWKADELTVDQLFGFLGAIEEADRPT